MKKLILASAVLMSFATFAQKKVTCSHVNQATKKEFKVEVEIKGNVYYEGTVSNNAGLTEFGYADFDGTNIVMTKYTINKNDKTCFSVYEYTIPKSKVNWKLNDMFSSASKKSTAANGTVNITLGGAAFGGNVAKEKVIVPYMNYNYTKDTKTALGIFQTEKKYKKFFRIVTK